MKLAYIYGPRSWECWVGLFGPGTSSLDDPRPDAPPKFPTGTGKAITDISGPSRLADPVPVSEEGCK